MIIKLGCANKYLLIIKVKNKFVKYVNVNKYFKLAPYANSSLLTKKLQTLHLTQTSKQIKNSIQIKWQTHWIRQHVNFREIKNKTFTNGLILNSKSKRKRKRKRMWIDIIQEYNE